tara:strand:- start:575 stop:901 length:327 start_codon:yes stop_codon:yes gene_type:complete
MSYAEAVRSAQAKLPAGQNWAPLTGEFDPKIWARDVWELYGDRQRGEDEGFGHDHGWPEHPVDVFNAVSVEVDEMLMGMEYGAAVPNPVQLAEAVTDIILCMLRKGKR